MIVGLAHGCFDVLHFGHVAHLEAARKLCDRLVVCVTPDAYVNKGPDRPVFEAARRALVLQSLRAVDHVFIGEGPDVAIRALRLVMPARYFKGNEYWMSAPPAFEAEREFCRAAGIDIAFTNEDSFSSTETIKRLKEVTNE